MHALIRTFAAGLVILLSPYLSARAATLHVGYQRYGTLILLKERGTLEAALRPLGWSVEWKLFPSGPPLLEALNAGAIDLGTTGETPPVFAEAAGAPIVYIGAEPPAPTGEAILVPQGSKIRSLAELKGHRVAYTRGSNANFLLLRALQSAGLTWSDITPVNLAPADGPAAFVQGAVDAWSIWDPYEAVARTSLGARVLHDGTGLVSNVQYFIAARGFATRDAPVLEAVMKQVAASDAWGETHHAQVAQLLARSSGLAVPVVSSAVSRLSFGVRPMTDPVIARQQGVADALAKAGLIPEPVAVREATLPGGSW